MSSGNVTRLQELISEQLAHGGYFLTFEGGDGSGKTTISKMLADVLQEANIPVLLTREPGGTPLGVKVRELVMHGPDDVDARTEALLYASDRAYHVATIVRPALAAGYVVLGDRYIDSSVAYQGAARNLGIDEIRGLSEWATGGLYPDLTVYFDVDTEVGLSRTGSAPDRLERSGTQFHRRVRQHYLEMVDEFSDRFMLLDAAGTIEETYDKLLELLINLFETQTATSDRS